MKQLQVTRKKLQDFSKTLLLCLATCNLLLLTACGFQPMYGKNKYTAVGVEEKLALIDIANIPNREGQFLHNELMERFYRNGKPTKPLYTLSISALSETGTNLDVTPESDSTRGQLTLRGKMRLLSNQGNKTLIARDIQSISSYNILNSEFATRVSEENARQNALNDMARQIEQQVNLYFKRSQ